MAYDHDATRQQADDLEAAILQILRHHVGARSAIKARSIARALNLEGRYADRPVREAIKGLRRQGHLILSSVREPYGYFIAESEEEWLAFRDANLKPRAIDILETASAMGQAANERWGGVGEGIRQLALGLEVVA